MQDKQLKNELQEILRTARKNAFKQRRVLSVRHVGMTHASEKYSRGWYVFIQNFDSLTDAKRSKDDDRYTRLNFRIVTTRPAHNEPEKDLLQVLVWHPTIGNQSNSEDRIIFEEEFDSGKDRFTQFMTTAINMTSK